MHSLQPKPVCPALHSSPPMHHSGVLHNKHVDAPPSAFHSPAGHFSHFRSAAKSSPRYQPGGQFWHSLSVATNSLPAGHVWQEVPSQGRGATVPSSHGVHVSLYTDAGAIGGGGGAGWLLSRGGGGDVVLLYVTADASPTVPHLRPKSQLRSPIFELNLYPAGHPPFPTNPCRKPL